MKNNINIEVDTLAALFNFNGIYYKDLNTKKFVQTQYKKISQLKEFLHNLYPQYDDIYFYEKVKDRRQIEWNNEFLLS